MDSKVIETLKSCCKDDAAFEELKALFGQLSNEKEQYKKWLDLLERTINHDYDSILITDLDMEPPGPHIVYVNDGFTRITGYSREDAIGQSPRILQGAKTDPKVLGKLKERLLEGNSFYGHTVNYRKDGSEFVNQWDIHPLRDEEGNITHWVSFQHDVTERKRSEKMLVDVGVDFDNLKEESRSILVDLDETGHIRKANKAFRLLTGYDNESLKGADIRSFVTGKNSKVFNQLFDESSSKEAHSRIGDILLKTSHGNDVEVVAKPRILKSDNGGIVRLMFENRDLQKRIVQMLRKRESGFNRVFNKATDFQYKVATNDDGAFIFSSITDNCKRITGQSPEELKGQRINSFVHPDDVQKMKNHFSSAFDGRSNTEIYRFKANDGSWRILLDYAKPLPDEDGSISEVTGTATIEVSSENKA